MRLRLILGAAGLVLCASVLAQSYRVGPIATSDGNNATPRAGRFGETIQQAAGDVNRERVRRGNVYFACDQAAGVAPGTALGTTAHLVLYNPQNSGVLVSVIWARSQYLSGTLGTGNMYHCVATSTTQTAPSAGTLLTNRAALNGNNVAAVAVARTGATVIQPVAIMPYAYLAPELATSVTAPQQTGDNLQDIIQLLPGTSYQLQSVAAAGTSPLMTPAVGWEEIPLTQGQP